jgi:RNA polymerase sigma-70 factor (ECF subfamily)
MDAAVEMTMERVRQVYETDHARLWRSVYGFARSRHVADEAVAETFAQALRRGDELRDVQAWVWRTAFNIARGELQRASTRAGGLHDDVADWSSERVDEGPGLSNLMDSLSALSEDDREILVLCHVGGWTAGELGPILGESSGALRVRLHRATKRARALLDGEDR